MCRFKPRLLRADESPNRKRCSPYVSGQHDSVEFHSGLSRRDNNNYLDPLVFDPDRGLEHLSRACVGTGPATVLLANVGGNFYLIGDTSTLKGGTLSDCDPLRGCKSGVFFTGQDSARTHPYAVSKANVLFSLAIISK